MVIETPEQHEAPIQALMDTVHGRRAVLTAGESIRISPVSFWPATRLQDQQKPSTGLSTSSVCRR